MEEFELKCKISGGVFSNGVEGLHSEFIKEIHQVVNTYPVEFNMDPTSDKSKVWKLGLFTSICDSIKINISDDITEDNIQKQIDVLVKSIVLTVSEYVTLDLNVYLSIVSNMVNYKVNIYRQNVNVLNETVLGKSFLSKDDLELIRNNRNDFRKASITI